MDQSAPSSVLYVTPSAADVCSWKPIVLMLQIFWGTFLPMVDTNKGARKRFFWFPKNPVALHNTLVHDSLTRDAVIS